MASNFSDLRLDSDRIENAVRSYATDGKVSVKTTDKYTQYDVVLPDAEPAKIQVFLKNNGKVTLHTKVGTNTELSCLIAEHIVKECVAVEYVQKPLSLKFLSEEAWKFLISHLKDDWKFSVEEKVIQHAQRFDVRKSKGDEVFLHRYNTGSFVMQGKARQVYGIVASCLCDLVEDKRKVIEAQLESYSVQDIKTDDILKELAELAPTASEVLGETGIAILSPSLAFIKLDISLTDYAAFVHPALRGLEGYLKSILAHYDYTVPNSAGFGDYLPHGKAKPSLKAKCAASDIEALEESYAVYHKHRNSLFHVDAQIVTTRIIENRQEAINIVMEIMRTLEVTAVKLSYLKK